MSSTGVLLRLAKLLDRLGMVAVPGHAIGLEVVRGFGEQQADLRLAPGARRARLAIRDQVLAVDHARFEERDEAQLDRRRIAPRVADDARLADLVAMELRQPVHRFLEQVGARVLQLVPLLEQRDVADPEVGREVDHLHVGVHQLARLRHRHAVRCREEDDIAGFEIRRVGCGERELVVLAAQAREHVDHPRTRFAARRDRAYVGLGMRCQDSEELDPGVAGAADDADLDHCVILDSGNRF
jgi:hypothetical protein